MLGTAVAVTLCAGVAVPFGAAADLAYTQRALLDRVFPTAPAPGPAAAVPIGPVLPARMNVLLLGSDAGPDRTGARTDTMIVASIDTRTAATTLFALPRNIQHAPFPPGSPAAARFPDGFHNPRAPASGDYLLNNVAEYGRAHPTLAPAGPTTDRGLNLLMSSITTMLGLPMTHYVMVDMDGLAALIDALGGVTVDVGPDPLPIGGVTYSGRHVTPEGYVPAGIHHLDGDQALWFARSRRNSDDYDRMGRQRCLIGALVSQKSPADVVAHFQQVTAAAAASISTNIPQSLLPALARAGRRAPAGAAQRRLRPGPAGPRRRPRAVRSGGPGRRVHAAGRPRRAGAAGRAGTAAGARRTGTVVDGRPGTVRDGERRTGAGAGLRGVELHGPLLSEEPGRPD